MVINGHIWPHMVINPMINPTLSPTLNPMMKYDPVFGPTVRFLINFRLTDPQFSVIGSVSRFDDCVVV